MLLESVVLCLVSSSLLLSSAHPVPPEDLIQADKQEISLLEQFAPTVSLFEDFGGPLNASRLSCADFDPSLSFCSLFPSGCRPEETCEERVVVRPAGDSTSEEDGEGGTSGDVIVEISQFNPKEYEGIIVAAVLNASESAVEHKIGCDISHRAAILVRDRKEGTDFIGVPWLRASHIVNKSSFLICSVRVTAGHVQIPNATDQVKIVSGPIVGQPLPSSTEEKISSRMKTEEETVEEIEDPTTTTTERTTTVEEEEETTTVKEEKKEEEVETTTNEPVSTTTTIEDAPKEVEQSSDKERAREEFRRINVRLEKETEEAERRKEEEKRKDAEERREWAREFEEKRRKEEEEKKRGEEEEEKEEPHHHQKEEKKTEEEQKEEPHHHHHQKEDEEKKVEEEEVKEEPHHHHHHRHHHGHRSDEKKEDEEESVRVRPSRVEEENERRRTSEKREEEEEVADRRELQRNEEGEPMSEQEMAFLRRRLDKGREESREGRTYDLDRNSAMNKMGTPIKKDEYATVHVNAGKERKAEQQRLDSGEENEDEDEDSDSSSHLSLFAPVLTLMLYLFSAH